MGRFRRGRGVSGYHLAPCTALCGRLSCVVSSGPGPMCCLTLQNRPIRWAWLSIPHASRSGLGRHHRRRLPPRRSRGCGGRFDVSRSLPEALVFLVPTTMWRCIRIADPGHFACQFTTVAANSSCRARSGLRDPAEDLHQDRYVRRHYGPLGELWQERRHRCSAAYRSARTNGCRAACARRAQRIRCRTTGRHSACRDQSALNSRCRVIHNIHRIENPPPPTPPPPFTATCFEWIFG